MNPRPVVGSAAGMLAAGLLALVLLVGCAPRWRTAPPPRPVGTPLPPLHVQPPMDTARPPFVQGRHDILDPLAGLPLGEPVTLYANDVGVPALLVALGEAIGISLVVDPEIAERITVNFQEVPAREAMRVVLEQAGLFIATGPPEVPWAPVVFYAVPTDIDAASVETIQARFNVSRAMAEFIVRSRVR